MTKKTRSSTRLIAAVAVATIPLAGVIHKRNADWEAMRGVVDSLSVVGRYQVDHREALYGETTDGSVWPQYKVAVEAMRAIDGFHRVTPAAASAASEQEISDRDALLAEAAPVLEYVRRGAHARDATSHVQLARGYAARIQRLVDVRSISNLAIARAEALIEVGDDVSAVQVLLDAHQMARDLVQSPCLIEEMVGCALLVPASMDRFLLEGGATRLNDDALTLWLDGLDQLAGSIPAAGRSFAGELTMAGWQFIGMESGGSWDRDLFGKAKSAGLRYGLSWRSAAADYVLRLDAVADEVDAAYSLEAPAALEALRLLELELKIPANPVVEACLPKFASGAKARIKGLARLAFLRHALALQLGRSAPLPDDPFGAGIQLEHTAERVRVWTEESPRRVLELVLGARR